MPVYLTHLCLEISSLFLQLFKGDPFWCRPSELDVSRRGAFGPGPCLNTLRSHSQGHGLASHSPTKAADASDPVSLRSRQ